MTAAGADADERLRTLVHALRTPLTIVEGFADALARRGEHMTGEERAEYLERIGDAAREMAELLDGAGR
jgi:signal transduction histidine kinase